jgi:phospholipid-translocating ATPase
MWLFSRKEKEKHRDVVRTSGSLHCDNTVTNSKYTIITFFPLNLFEQFHRPINLYFLIVALLQFIPSIAPVSPLSTVGPLLVAFSITAAKEGYDDYCRHKQDKEDNSRLYRRIRKLDSDATPVVEDVRCANILVGDIIVLGQYDMLPCDAVPLLSSNGDGSVYVSTENLDGESDAKEKLACFADLWCSEKGVNFATARTEVVEQSDALMFLESTEFTIHSEGPNKNLAAYEATIEFRIGEHEKRKGLALDNFLPATSIVRNTFFVLAVVIFTGNESKVGMTKQFPPSKWALLDQECTRFAKCVFVFQFSVVVLWAAIGAFVTEKEVSEHWYLQSQSSPPDAMFYALVLPLRYFLMATLMVPISFKVTVDISKAYVSKVMEWDLGMYRDDQNAFCKVNNSALAEDLGQIEYVLTDKTGTLTENKMNFCHLLTQEGHVHSVEDNTLSVVADAAQSNHHLMNLIRCLTMCNTVERTALPSGRDESSMVTHASSWTSPSPDEIALVEGASKCGAALLERTRRSTTIRINDDEETYEIVYLIRFTSHRGKMSAIVRSSSGQFLLLTKGSDERILPICTDEGVDKAMISRRLNEFASKGLRTLTFGFRELDEQSAAEWTQRVASAEAEIETSRRTTMLEELYAEIEMNLTFCGATAVEDELQPQVRETIVTLRQASIKVWMLTGDKLETAKQIAATSGLVGPNDCVVDFVCSAANASQQEQLDHINEAIKDLRNRPETLMADSAKSANHFSSVAEISREFTKQDELSTQFLDTVVRAGAKRQNGKDGSSKSMKSEETLGLLQRERIDTYTASPEDYCVLVTGAILAMLQHDDHCALFEEFCKVVLGASTVICCRTTPDQKASIVRLVKTSGRMTLAVGDGGNDVAMIQEAHVGVGVEGVEGRQASKAADFSIARFRFLRRLLLVHGHTAFQRTAYIVQQSFYKSMMIAWVQLLYNVHTLFSGVTFWNSFALTMWNGAFTIPLTFLYVTDVQLQPNILLCIPSLYQLSQKARYLNGTTFLTFILRGIAQGTIAYYLSCALFSPATVASNGITPDLQTQFVAPYGGLVVLVAFTVLLESHSFWFLQWLAILGCVAAFLLSFVVYSDIFKTLEFYGAFNVLLRNNTYYLVTLAVVACNLIPHCIYGGIKFWYLPSRLQLQRGFLKRISLIKSHTVLREQFPEDNPSVLWGSLYPSGCSEARDIAPSHDEKGTF